MTMAFAAQQDSPSLILFLVSGDARQGPRRTLESAVSRLWMSLYRRTERHRACGRVFTERPGDVWIVDESSQKT